MKKAKEQEVKEKGGTVRTSTVTFKKAFSGFDMSEVLDYIEQQDKNYTSTCAMYDSKIDSYKDNISLLNRENESLKSQLEEIKKSLETSNERNAQIMSLSVAAFKKEKEKSGDIKLDDLTQALIDEANEQLTSELLKARTRIEQLMDEIEGKEKQITEISGSQSETENVRMKLDEQMQKNDELTEKNIDLLNQIDTLNAEIKSVNDEKARLDEVVADAKQMYAQVERLKTQTESYKESAKNLQIQLIEKGEQLSVMQQRFDNQKKTIDDQLAQIGDYSEQLEKLEKMNAEIIENSMSQKREAQEEKNRIITEYNAKFHELTQAVQLHSYQFKQVGLVFSELEKHISKAEETLEKVNEKQ